MRIILPLCFFLSITSGYTQSVITLAVKGLNGPNGFALDRKGRLYIANEPGKKVVAVESDFSIREIISSDSPDGLAFGPDGKLYISNFFSGTVLTYYKERIDTLIKGLNHPADLKLDDKGNLFVSEYDGDAVVRIDKSGKRSIYASGIKKPFGLALGKGGFLYVASNTTGEIYKVNEKEKKLFATIPGAVAYITISKKTGNLYAPCFTCHKIFKVSAEGVVTLVSGKDKAGNKDGPINEAEFDSPNSIVLSEEGHLYISEFSANRIRKILNVE
jgi:sugar lactone lactonase YvrE